MGLDMYGMAKKIGSEEEDIEIAYWRKHNALHNWMEKLWESKTAPENMEGDFNCVDVPLTKEDLLKLQTDVLEGNLEPAIGFFFGDQSYMDNYTGSYTQAEDLVFIAKALASIEEGREIYYTSWW